MFRLFLFCFPAPGTTTATTTPTTTEFDGKFACTEFGGNTYITTEAGFCDSQTRHLRVLLDACSESSGKNAAAAKLGCRT